MNTEETTEFYPLSHTFDSSVFGRGRIAHRNRGHTQQKPSFIYRFDSNFLEIRDIAFAERRVLASIHARDLAQNDEELTFIAVAYAVISQEQSLIICASNGETGQCKFFVYNPWKAITTVLPLQTPIYGAVTSLGISALCMPTEYDIENNQNDPYHILLIGMADGKLIANRLFPSEGGDTEVIVEPVNYAISKSLGMITAIEFFVASTFDEFGSTPIVAVGGSNGRVEILQFQKTNDKKKDFSTVIELDAGLDAGDSEAPVQILQIIPNLDSDDTFLLAVGQGDLYSVDKSNHLPSVCIREVSVSRSQQKLIGYVSAIQPNGEILENGQVLSLFLLSDGSSYRLLASFSVRTKSTTFTTLGLWAIAEDNIILLNSADISDLSSEYLQDLFPRNNSLECILLYLNKMIIYSEFLVDDFEKNSMAIDNQDQMTETFNEHFDDSLEPFPYDASVVKQIKERRSKMDKELFIDKLLEFTGAQVGAFYPPKNMNVLQQLYELVWTCELDDLKKHCIVYYLLKDWSSNRADKYAAAHIIPQHFQFLMSGYWAIDHWEFQDALQYLSDPTVEVDWGSKIVKTLNQFHGHTEANRFISMAHPSLQDPDDLETELDIIAYCDVIDAFLFQRQQVSYACRYGREKLLQRLFDYIFSERRNRSSNIYRLLSAPFDRAEEAFMIKYCLRSKYSLSRDFLIMYYVHHGRYIDAIKLNDQLRSVESVFKGSGGGGINRNSIIENMKLLLPEVQRHMLELEAEKAIPLQLEIDESTEDDVVMELNVPITSQSLDKVAPEDGGSSPAPAISTANVEILNETIPPLSASKAMRQSFPIMDAVDISINPQKTLLRAVVDQMERESSRSPSPLAKRSVSLRGSLSLKSSANAVATPDSIAKDIISSPSPFVGPPSTPKEDMIDRIRDEQYVREPQELSPALVLGSSRSTSIVGSNAFEQVSPSETFGRQSTTEGIARKEQPSKVTPLLGNVGPTFSSLSPFSNKKSQSKPMDRQKGRLSDLGTIPSPAAKIQLGSPILAPKQFRPFAKSRQDQVRFKNVETDSMEIEEHIHDEMQLGGENLETLATSQSLQTPRRSSRKTRPSTFSINQDLSTPSQNTRHRASAKTEIGPNPVIEKPKQKRKTTLHDFVDRPPGSYPDEKSIQRSITTSHRTLVPTQEVAGSSSTTLSDTASAEIQKRPTASSSSRIGAILNADLPVPLQSVSDRPGRKVRSQPPKAQRNTRSTTRKAKGGED